MGLKLISGCLPDLPTLGPHLPSTPSHRLLLNINNPRETLQIIPHNASVRTMISVLACASLLYLHKQYYIPPAPFLFCFHLEGMRSDSCYCRLLLYFCPYCSDHWRLQRLHRQFLLLKRIYEFRKDRHYPAVHITFQKTTQTNKIVFNDCFV